MRVEAQNVVFVSHLQFVDDTLLVELKFEKSSSFKGIIDS